MHWKCVDKVTDILLHSCFTVDFVLFTRNNMPSNEEATFSVTSRRGMQECGMRTSALGLQSFTFHQSTNSCDMFHSNGGEYLIQ